MSEDEKAEQIGKLAVEYSEARGKLNHINEKLNRAHAAYMVLGVRQSFDRLRVIDGVLSAPTPPNFNATPSRVDGLLGTEQLIHVVEERDQCSSELDRLTERLRAVAPHLLP
jgi:hypothetical protein